MTGLYCHDLACATQFPVTVALVCKAEMAYGQVQKNGPKQFFFIKIMANDFVVLYVIKGHVENNEAKV